MKKLIISVMAIIMAITSMSAQNTSRITVSTSDNLPLVLGSIITGGVIGSVTDAPAGTKLGDVTSHGCFSLGYSYDITPRFAVGGELTYAGAKINFEADHTNTKVSSDNANIFMVMPTAKYTYFKKDWFSLGGDVAVGVMSDFKDATGLAFQVDPLDFRFGSDKAAGFLRMGLGVKGIFTIGFDIAL